MTTAVCHPVFSEPSNISLSMIKPPVAARVDHHSIEFVWERANDAAKGDKRYGNNVEVIVYWNLFFTFE